MTKMDLVELARLVDEEPKPEEAALIERDPELARELEALKRQTSALADLPAMLPPQGRWAELEPRLRREGLIASEPIRVAKSAARPARRFGLPHGRSMLQAAAALVLFIAGGVAGRWLVAEAPGSQPPMVGDVASSLVPPDGPASFASIEEAQAAVWAAEQSWARAYQGYRRLVDAEDSSAPYRGNWASRMAAVDALMAASHAVIGEAPADPFVNGFLARTLIERGELLRQRRVVQQASEGWH